MKRILILFVMLAHVAVLVAGKHILISDTLTDSKIYPGTVHTLQVYVPDQYTGEEPACLLVGLDGVLCNAPTVIDTLIAQGKMPVTIGVFLQPGVIKDATGTIAFGYFPVTAFRSMIAFSNSSGSMFQVVGSESTNTGVAPR